MQTDVTSIAPNSYPSLSTYSARWYFLDKHKFPKVPMKKNKSATNGLALSSEYDFLIHYEQKQ